MRASLLAFLVFLCLPLQWAGAAAGVVSLHEPCDSLHAGVSDSPWPSDADGRSLDAHAQHTHCVSCHTTGLASPASLPLMLGETGSVWVATLSPWKEILLIERPERPQWPALA